MSSTEARGHRAKIKTFLLQTNTKMDSSFLALGNYVMWGDACVNILYFAYVKHCTIILINVMNVVVICITIL